MNGFFGTGPADVVATWVAAAATLIVFGGLLGERRVFGWSQHLLAGLALVAIAAAAPWLPRIVAAVPVSIAIGALAAFGLGGAVIGTILPQLAVAVATDEGSMAGTVTGVAAAGVSGLVLIGFLHGAPRGRVLDAAASAGRWLLVAGIGAWLGYLILSRLVLLLDRIGFLLGDWLGIGR